MKLITSLDEWWEARELDRLESFDDGEWKQDRTLGSPSAQIGGVMRLIKEKRYRWAPEEITLVEVKTNHPEFPVMYVDRNKLQDPCGSFTYRSDALVPNGLFKLSAPEKAADRRTVTGVISDGGAA